MKYGINSRFWHYGEALRVLEAHDDIREYLVLSEKRDLLWWAAEVTLDGLSRISPELGVV